MKIFLILTILLLCFSTITGKISETPQIPNFLIYNSDTLSISTNPLEGYFENTPRPDILFDENSTNCWHGYTAYYELKEDSLFLIELHGDSSIIDLELIFQNRKTDDKIFADWFDSSILIFYGSPIYFNPMTNNNIYEFEREFIFSNGIITKIKEYDNSKTKKSKFTQKAGLLKKYIQSNINYSNLTKDPYKSAKVYVEICSVSKEGKIDSVRLKRGCDDERNKEAIRVIESIPNWDVIYSHGKQIQIPVIIPVIFGKINK